MIEEKDKKRVLKDLVERFKKLLPDENVEGDPFWGLMEIRGGKLTGNYYVIQSDLPHPNMALPLFFRETDAENFRTTRKEKDIINKYVVRGFTKEQLRLLTLPDENAKIVFLVFLIPPKSGGTWPCLIYDAGKLSVEFVK